MTLSDLAKYSMTRSVARYLCDSWASFQRDIWRSHGQISMKFYALRAVGSWTTWLRFVRIQEQDLHRNFSTWNFILSDISQKKFSFSRDFNVGITYSDMKVWSRMFVVNVQSGTDWNTISWYTRVSNILLVVCVVKVSDMSKHSVSRHITRCASQLGFSDV